MSYCCFIRWNTCRLLLVPLWLIALQGAAQQNLVYNGDFEEYDSCPTNPSTPNNLQIEHCLGWTAPRKLGTSDYFNSCNNALAGVPNNQLGYQYPYNGNGYCGFFAWALDAYNFNYREYIQTKLSNRLKEGRIYSLTFYVSYYGGNLSLEKIGALLSGDSFTEQSSDPIESNPQVVNRSGVLADSSNWIKIEGEFIATGNEEYLTIGYFEHSNQVFDTLNTYGDPFCGMESYYFVDGVELIETTKELPNILTPNKDGVNDVFDIDLYVDKFTVLNRWGNLIFQAENTFPLWDGTNKTGEYVEEGTYYYVIEINHYKTTGFIQLIR